MKTADNAPKGDTQRGGCVVSGKTSDFIKVTCAPLPRAGLSDARDKIAFYSYRGPHAGQFPNLRAADTNNDGTLDFVIGVTDKSFDDFLGITANETFIPRNQRLQALWSDPIFVARSELQAQCNALVDGIATESNKFMGVEAAGALVLVAGCGLVVVGTAPFTTTLGLVGFVVGAAVMGLGRKEYAHAFTETKGTFIKSLETLIQSRIAL